MPRSGVRASPPCADDLAATLGLSRSNVSTALRELRGWGSISRVGAPGDRKDYFTAPADPSAIVRLLLSGRQRRAIAPAPDQLLTADAETGDLRIAALHSALATISERMEAFAALDAADLALRFLSGPNAKPADGRSAGKKKKRKRND